MARAKKSAPAKTALEIALEEPVIEVKKKAPRKKIVEKAAEPISKSKSEKPRRETKTSDFVRYVPPKLTFSRKRIRYKEGDKVEIIEAGETYTGKLISILSSQLVVETDEGLHKFFFQSGINIKKVK